MNEKEKKAFYIAMCSCCLIAQSMKRCSACLFNVGLGEQPMTAQSVGTMDVTESAIVKEFSMMAASAVLAE